MRSKTFLAESIALNQAHPLFDFELLLFQRLPRLVLVRYDGDGERPLQRQAWVIVQQATFRFRCVEFSHLIARFRFVRKCLVSVSEALRHVERAAVLLAELGNDVLQIGWAFRTQVDDDVEDSAPSGPYELRLGGWWKLKMHAPQRSFLLAESNIGLGDDGLQPVRLKFILTENAGEKAPRILSALDIDDKCALQLCFRKDHVGVSL